MYLHHFVDLEIGFNDLSGEKLFHIMKKERL